MADKKDEIVSCLKGLIDLLRLRPLPLQIVLDLCDLSTALERSEPDLLEITFMAGKVYTCAREDASLLAEVTPFFDTVLTHINNKA